MQIRPHADLGGIHIGLGRILFDWRNMLEGGWDSFSVVKYTSHLVEFFLNNGICLKVARILSQWWNTHG